MNKLLIVRFPPFNAGVADGLINMQHFVPTFAISGGRDSLLSHKQMHNHPILYFLMEKLNSCNVNSIPLSTILLV